MNKLLLGVATPKADNGTEFTCHEAISTVLNTDFYFAHRYHSWERGLNENTNGLIRQYIPKGTDLTTLSDDDLEPDRIFSQQ